MVVLITPILVSCGLNYSVDGKVVDANTGQPVEGAVVAVNWQRTKLGIPGLPVPRENYGTFEAVTDTNGIFSIPKYLIGHYYLAVYKSGYFCWSSETIFKPEGKDWKEMFVPRYGHRMKSGMMVKMVPKTDDYPKVKHARFILDVGTALSSPKPKFNEAVEEERQIYKNFIDERKRKGKK